MPPGFEADDSQETHPESYFSGTSNPDSAMVSAAGLSSRDVSSPSYSYGDVNVYSGDSVAERSTSGVANPFDPATEAGHPSPTPVSSKNTKPTNLTYTVSTDTATKADGFLRIFFQIESAGGQNIPNVHKTTTSGQARGYFQITTGTWLEFAPRAGIDLGRYPEPMKAPYSVQAKVASIIPMGRWDPITLNALRSAGYKVNTRATLEQNVIANGGHLNGKGAPYSKTAFASTKVIDVPAADGTNDPEHFAYNPKTDKFDLPVGDTPDTPDKGGLGNNPLFSILKTVAPGTAKVIETGVKKLSETPIKIPTRQDVVQYYIEQLFKGGTPPVDSQHGTSSASSAAMPRRRRKLIANAAAPVHLASEATASIAGGSSSDTLSGGSGTDKLTQSGVDTLTNTIGDIFGPTLGGIFDLGKAIVTDKGAQVLGGAVKDATIGIGQSTKDPVGTIANSALSILVDNLPLIGGVLLVILLLIVGTKSLTTS